MANATVSRIGAANLDATNYTTELALFLKVFGQEVLVAYKKACVAEPHIYTRTIASGKSAQFPMVFTNTAGYHVPGAEILGTTVRHAEKIINICGFLVSSAFLAEIDEAMNHYDVRSVYSNETGFALAREYDTHAFRAMICSARTAADVGITGWPGGLTKTNAAYATDADTIATGIFDAVQNFAEKNVPVTDPKTCFLAPAQYYLLASNKDLMNTLWGGRGSLAEATIPQVAGVQLQMTNLLPRLDDSTTSSGDATYLANLTIMGLNKVYTNNIAVISTKWAAGVVKLKDLTVEHTRDGRRLGDLITARYALGYGVLRPECAVELKTA